MSRKKNNTKGFTLLEVLIALLILASGIVLLTSTWGGSLLRLRKTQLNTEISALLERKMAEIDLKYRGKPLESIPEEESGDFGSDYPQYQWQLQSQEFNLPDIASTLTSKEGGADAQTLQLMKTFTEALSKSVKEVKVSIVYKKNGKKIEFSVTTLFFDYDKPLPLPGMGGGA